MSNYTKELKGEELKNYLLSNRFPSPKNTIMKESIKTELTEHLNEFIKDNNLVKWARPDSELHFHAFNEDYYIIGYYQAAQWLKKHDLDTFKAIGICQEFELEHFGELQTTYDNAEILVNHLVYWYGLEICNELELN
jgi:hypothetical protein|tara:strand:+ start:225 stop:635 length:411 start_codon:yes stop_codon:yes gene_type:complete